MFSLRPAAGIDLGSVDSFEPDAWCDLEGGAVTRIDTPTGTRQVFLPCHYEPGYEYPLIVWLTANQQELGQWFPAISERNYVAVAASPVPPAMARRRAAGLRSFDLSAATAAVDAAIEDAADEFTIHPERIFVAGTGDLGALALSIWMSPGRPFAGAIAVDVEEYPLSLALREFRELNGRQALLAKSDESGSPRSMLEFADLLVAAQARAMTTCSMTPGGSAAGINRWLMQIVTGVVAEL
jgi:phospholipase/carboxylesterase